MGGAAAPTDKKGGKWSPDEDDRLRTAVGKLGEDKWVAVAGCVGSRDRKQCRKRWKALKPGVVKGRWTEDEVSAPLCPVVVAWASTPTAFPTLPPRLSF